MIATLWLAPGVLFRNDIAVPNPPPPYWVVDILEPVRLVLAYSTAELSPPDIHRAEFRLRDWSRTGEVAHYELATRPPAGWRWESANGRLWCERT